MKDIDIAAVLRSGKGETGLRLEAEGKMINGNVWVGCIGLIGFIGYKGKVQMSKGKESLRLEVRGLRRNNK